MPESPERAERAALRRRISVDLLARFLPLAAFACGARSPLDAVEIGAGGASSSSSRASSHASSSVASTVTAATSSVSASSSSGGCLDAGATEQKCYDAGDAPCEDPSTIVGQCRPDWGGAVLAIDCSVERLGTMCCYEVVLQMQGCYVGRAFLADEGLIRAELRRGGGWRRGEAPDVSRLDAATRAALAEHWLLDGLFEHASVATFARFSMQLLAVGAPAALVRDAHAAAIDEIKHAELCFALASAYRGEDIEPEPFPMPASLAIDRDLAAIVVESVVEGCIGETLAAAQAAEQLARATDRAVALALTATLEDEIRHAELSWRFVAWAIDTGGEATRRAVAAAFANFVPPSPRPIDMRDVDTAAFAAHGRLAPEVARAAAITAIRDVVGPCSCALLARRASGIGPDADSVVST